MKREIVVFALLILLVLQLTAQVEKGKMYIGNHISGIQLIGGDESSKVKAWWGLDFDYYFSKRLGFELSSSIGWVRPNEDKFGRSYITYLYPITANLKFNFVTDKKFVPYGLIGAGILFWDLRDVTTYDEDYMFWERRGSAVWGGMQKDMEIIGGLGANYFFSDHWAMDTGFRYHLLTEHEKDMSGYGDEHSAVWEVRLGIGFTFGGVKDQDKDGVRDSKDLCPNTPKGISIDKDGCPVDSDDDGVPDYLDQCDNTPEDAKVDAKGCPMDSDSDGIPDHIDRCPNTPKRVSVDKEGCPIDSDKDGIADYQDKCPNTPANVSVDKRGCPIDTDRDGIPDYKDKCPNTKMGIETDEFGCEIVKEVEEPETLEVKETVPIILDGITFESGKSSISDIAKRELIKVLNTLKAYPEMKLDIVGYTDNTGDYNYNVMLSKKRAAAVKDYLVSQGIEASRLHSDGFGPKNPIAPNDTREGRAKNRRIEFKRM